MLYTQQSSRVQEGKMIYQRCCKRYLTLFELLLVLSILSTILGVVAVNLASAYRVDSFRAGVSLLVSKLQTAQEIMLISRTSVKVFLTQTEEGLSVQMRAEGALSPLLKRSILEKTVIKEIASFRFSKGNEIFTDRVTLCFLSGGTIMSKGILELTKGGLSEKIYLCGFPKVIKAGDPKKIEPEVTPELTMQWYPAEVREKRREGR